MRLVALALTTLTLAGCATGPRMDEPRRAFLGQAAVPSEVIAAELAFARMAREKGTWTAFRDTATEDALWPSPGRSRAQSSRRSSA